MHERLLEPLIPPSVLAGVVDIGHREGRDVSSWFTATGVDPSLVVTSADAKVSFRQAASVLRRAVRSMPGRPLGMQLAGRDVLLTFGMLGVAMRACATVGDALGVAREFHQAAGSLMDVEDEYVGDDVVLRVYERFPEPELVAFLTEEVLCSTVAFLRTLIDTGPFLTSVELTYARPPYESEYHRFFRCPIQFDADITRLTFPASVLKLPVPTLDEPTKSMAVDACRRLLDSGSARSDVVTAVEGLLGANLRNPILMADAAETLHVTERTLRRQLALAGERFGGIRDRVRERRATFLLLESTLSIAAVGREVGFGDAREFTRSYVRWTGRAPSRVRGWGRG